MGKMPYVTSSDDLCKEKLCFLVLDHEPFILPTATLQNSPPYPFACNARQRDQENPGFGGLLFDVLDRLSAMQEDTSLLKDIMCVYAESRDKCTFDGSLQFMQDAHKSNNSGHMFIAGGRYIFLPQRRTPQTIQSAPWVSTDSVLMYARDSNSKTFYGALKNICKPFKFGAWIVVLGFAGGIIGGFILYGFFFSPYRSFRKGMYWIIIGEIHNSKEAGQDEDNDGDVSSVKKMFPKF